MQTFLLFVFGADVSGFQLDLFARFDAFQKLRAFVDDGFEADLFGLVGLPPVGAAPFFGRLSERAR